LAETRPVQKINNNFINNLKALIYVRMISVDVVSWIGRWRLWIVDYSQGVLVITPQAITVDSILGNGLQQCRHTSTAVYTSGNPGEHPRLCRRVARRLPVECFGSTLSDYEASSVCRTTWLNVNGVIVRRTIA